MFISLVWYYKKKMWTLIKTHAKEKNSTCMIYLLLKLFNMNSSNEQPKFVNLRIYDR